MSLSDEELVKRCLNGDRDSFSPLIERHGPLIRSLIRSMGPGFFEAEDLFQETLLQAFLGLSYLRNPSSFPSWLYGIAVNLTKMWYRGRRGFLSFEEMAGGTHRADFSLEDYYNPSPEVAYETVEINELIHRAIASLPEASRSAVLMHYIDGLSLQEISILLGTSVGTIKVRLHRGRENLRKELQGKIEMASSKSVKTKEKKMIPVTVLDVVCIVSKDEKKSELKDLSNATTVVLLKESSGDRVLLVYIGNSEGTQIAMQLAEATTPRPMTFDLMVNIFDISKITVEKVVVNALKEFTFYATITFKTGEDVHEIDARPSDAINLALRTQTPISVAEEVMDEAGFKITDGEDAPQKMEAIEKKRNENIKETTREILETSNQLEQELKRKPTAGEIGDKISTIREKCGKHFFEELVQKVMEGEEKEEEKEYLSGKTFFAEEAKK